MNDKKKVLWVLGGVMSYGGIELFTMNHLRHFDYKKFEVSILIHGFEDGVFDDELRELGVKKFHIPVKSKNPVKYFYKLNQFFKSHKFDIVHTHLDAMGSVILKYAKKYKIKTRIAHSHNTAHLTRNPLKILLNEIARYSIRLFATDYLACTLEAATWLYGNKIIESGEFTLIKNAISLDRFIFSPEERRQLRNQYKILNNETVIGHIGRFDFQKNHDFIIHLFQNLVKITKEHKLVLIGKGHLEKNIIELLHDFQLEDKVIIIPPQKDVERYYNMFDKFILPSHFEGLGMVAIEAQINGLPCYVSDQIPSDVKITNHLWHLPLSHLEVWVDNLMSETKRSEIDLDAISRSGYEISQSAKKLMDYYLKEN